MTVFRAVILLRMVDSDVNERDCDEFVEMPDSFVELVGLVPSVGRSSCSTVIMFSEALGFV